MQTDNLTNKKALVDYHLTKQAIYIELNTRVCQLVLDTVIGVAIFLIVAAYPDFFIHIVNYTCQLLHLEQLQIKIYWLLGSPAGFKPNANLAHFLGNFVLSLIRTWDHVTSALTNARSFIVLYIASVGWLGASLQAAALHDLLIMSQLWLVCVYTIFTSFYCLGLNMIGTLIRLFRGRKFNTIRGRVDSNNFNVSEMYLGIMVVSISLLLLPTLAIFYYYAFISIMLSVIGL